MGKCKSITGVDLNVKVYTKIISVAASKTHLALCAVCQFICRVTPSEKLDACVSYFAVSLLFKVGNIFVSQKGNYL